MLLVGKERAAFVLTEDYVAGEDFRVDVLGPSQDNLAVRQELRGDVDHRWLELPRLEVLIEDIVDVPLLLLFDHFKKINKIN